MIVFLDTNIFIQCKSVLDIDFSELTGDTENTVILPFVVIEELNDIKDRDINSKKKDKARKALLIITEADDTKCFSNNTKFCLYETSVNFDYHTENLNNRVNDDRLLAAVIENSRNNYTPSCLITLDVALKLKAKRHSILTFDLPDKYIVCDKPDPLVEENERLQAEIKMLKNRLPKTSLKFLKPSSDTNDVAKFTISNVAIDKEKIEANIQYTISKHPKLSYEDYLHKHDEGAVQDAVQASIIQVLNLYKSIKLIPQEEFERYNSELDDYYTEMRKYYETANRYQSAIARSIEFQIGIENTGSCPAKSVDVLLRFPNGFKLFEKDDFPDFPKKPSPPIKPMTPYEKLNRSISSINNSISYSNLSIPSLPDTYNPSNFNIKETNSYEVEDFFKSIKHGTTEPLPAMLLIFDSFQDAKSFHCEYELRPDNHPDAVIGKLHFVIEKQEIMSKG